MSEPLLQVKDLTKEFDIGSGFLLRNANVVHAVDRVSFDIQPGETLGLVGESGSGKSTTGRCILRLIEPTSGEVKFQGRNVSTLDMNAFRALCRDMQIIFQDPFASLNPRMTVGTIHRRGPDHPQARELEGGLHRSRGRIARDRGPAGRPHASLSARIPVSYTHLTLPTILRV